VKNSPKRKTAAILAVFMAFCLIFSVFPAAASAAVDPSIIRVKLTIGNSSTSSITSMNITVKGTYVIREKPGIILNDKTYTVAVSGTNVKLMDGKTTLYTGASVMLAQCNSLNNTISLYNNRYKMTLAYLGDMQFTSYLKEANKRYLQVINHVYVEQYLYGVVPNEMSDSWPLEALKTQAVCARGYAVRNISTKDNYDLGDTSGDQVYKGYNAKNTNTIKAVNDTAKKVLKYGSTIIVTYFAASNGGYTESPSNIWSHAKPVPYWVVKADPYDLRNKNSWQQTLFLPTDAAAYTAAHKDEEDNETIRSLNLLKGNYIDAKVKADGYVQNSEIFDYTILKINKITGTVNEWHKHYPGYICNHIESMKLEAAVRIVDPDTAATVYKTYTIDVPLSKFENWGIFSSSLSAYWLNPGKDSDGVDGYILRHARYGHGAGMSQRGAQQMANENIKYDKILAFYFPNTTLATLSTIKQPSPAKPSVAKPSVAGIGKVKSTTLAIRTAPNATAYSLGTLAKGKWMQITKKDYSSGWHQIWYNSQLAYVQTTNVTMVTPVKMYAKYSIVTMYSANAKTSAVLQKLSKGAAVNVYSTSGAFYYALVNGKMGYIATGDLSKTAVKPLVVAYARVTASKTVLRSSPSASSSSIATLVKNKTVDVIVLNYDKNWHRVWYNNKTVYVQKSQVSVSSGKDSAIKVSSANLYTTASSSSKKLAVLKKGTKVKYYFTSGKYAYINYNGLTGYVAKSAL
jgi:SpoIID/LytB domain protein